MTADSARTASLPTLAAHGVRGFCMGAADIVPGVSGGTIALILGIYPRLIENVRMGSSALGHLVKLDLSGSSDRIKAVEWTFLIPLLAGIGVALISLSQVLESLLSDYPSEMAGLFLGLVAASVVIAWRQVEGWDNTLYSLMAAVSVVTFVALGWQAGGVSDPTSWQFFGAGAIAITAMILPGISGSFLLLMLGMYGPLLSAVNEREIPEVAIFALGAIVGLALFSTLLGWLLDNHQPRVLAALTGLMIGSVRILWPWPNGVGVISDEETEVVKGSKLGWPDSFTDFFWPTLFALLAYAFVTGLSAYAGRRDPAHGSSTHRSGVKDPSP
ncbi:MAG: DUF368 domain-containing protein [Acidimicrobiales bacterium]